MTGLDRPHFAPFFEAVRGFAPFAWQVRLLDHVLDTGRWPNRIDAPTGSGKTAVVDVHVFANALSAVGAGPRVPRRLALVVGRRVLVDSHHEHAERLRQELLAPRDDVVRQVAQALTRLVPLSPRGVEAGSPLLVDSLRGGVPAPRGWRVEPEVCAVLACTPDMFGSRLLMRGYGTSRRARPQEAGLLAMDCVTVVDEAHLARQLVRTANRVAELITRAPRPSGVPVLQVVDTTATPDAATNDPGEAVEGEAVVGVTAADLAAGTTLEDRLTHPKPVTLLELPIWPAAASDSSKRAMASIVADEVDRLAALSPQKPDGTHRTVGCVLNRVEDAAAVARELRLRDAAAGSVVLLTGRSRPVDRDLLEQQHPGLLSIRGNAGVRAVVATQVLEVGVDVDLAALVTDLAPGTALAQRAGRVNRVGHRPLGPITVVVPREDLTEKSSTAPYRPSELQAALHWVRRLAQDPQGLAPWRLREETPPPQEPRRELWQRLSADDVRHLARTSAANFAEPDLALWLADDLALDGSRGLVLRHLMAAPDVDGDPSACLPVVRLTPPEEHETMPLSPRVLGKVLAAYREKSPTAPVLRYRADLSDSEDAVELVDTVDAEDTSTVFRAGDVVVLDATTAGPDVLPWLLRVPPVEGVLETRGQAFTDVYEVSSAEEADTAAGQNLRLGAFSPLDRHTLGEDVTRAVVEAATELVALGQAGGADEVSRARLLAAMDLVLTSAPMSMRGRVGAVRDLLSIEPHHVEVHVSEPDDPAGWVVLVDTRTALPAEDRLQLWSTGGMVLLDAHQQAVADRVASSAAALGVAPDVRESLRVAGLHHDDGKVDTRFQHEVLGAGTADAPWAKSGTPSTARARQRTARSTLPLGWRHEQLSVLLASRAADLQQAPDAALATRLIGTTHGWGRPAFPHGTADLLPLGNVEEDGVALFDEGKWEQIVEQTDRRYGPWGTAYLEALLRAADARVSREGS